LLVIKLRRATIAAKDQIELPPETPDLIREHGINGAAQMVGISGAGLRNRALREGWPTRMDAASGEQTFTLDNLPQGADWTPETLLKKVGLNPAEWRITNVKARGGHWGNPEAPSSQVRLELSVVPIAPLPFELPSLKGWKALPKPKARKTASVKTAVVCGDQHAPHHDKTLHALFCRYLADEQPDLIEINGDLLDFADISRHRQMPKSGPSGEYQYTNTVNECLQAGFNILYDYRKAAPNAQIRMQFGNHTQRLYFALVDNLKGLYDITAAEDDVPALSLRRLLRLDELHVELVEKDWEQAKTRVNRRLTVLHGHSTSKNPGQKMLNDLTGSTLQGHSHRISLNYRTSHDLDDGAETRLAGECGCMCEIEGGLDYARDPDWQSGFMIVKHWSDDDFTVAPAIYLPGRLLIPDGRRYDS